MIEFASRLIRRTTQLFCPVEKGDFDGGDRHYAIWSDPFPKPSYLFCAVAGNSGSIQDSFTTMTGRKVYLEIFSERENVNKLDFAMESLKRSMDWDEKTFGLEYDLDLYNIVAVSFSSGDHMPIITPLLKNLAI